MKFICYKKCSTCKRAEKLLEDKGQKFERIDYTEDPLSEEEVREIWKKSGLPLKNFFNTSGILYREMGMKNKLAQMSENEQIKLLSENPMLIKRPILILNSKILVGFKATDWNNL